MRMLADKQVVLAFADPCPVPTSRPASQGYPALDVLPGALAPELEMKPNITIFEVDAGETPAGAFPFDAEYGWQPGMKEDFLVPAYIPPEQLQKRYVAVTGIPGEWDQALGIVEGEPFVVQRPRTWEATARRAWGPCDPSAPLSASGSATFGRVLYQDAYISWCAMRGVCASDLPQVTPAVHGLLQ